LNRARRRSIDRSHGRFSSSAAATGFGFVAKGSMTDYFERTHRGSFWRERGSQPFLYRRRLLTIERAAGRRGRLLDVGSGEGHFVSLAASRGWRVTALDYLQEGAQKTAGRLGPGRTARGDALHLPFQAGVFEAVTMWDVVEHLPNPDAALREAARVLTPGGLLALSTPNTRARSVAAKGAAASQFQDPTHISLRDRTAWEQALHDADFDQVILGTDAYWDAPYPPSKVPTLAYKVAAQIRFATRYADEGLADGENLVGLFRRAQ
jgi:2-polyprenyl-3-methyl-5-hydroxy-6-metoxy-1,4-benzoquinol methylase